MLNSILTVYLRVSIKTSDFFSCYDSGRLDAENLMASIAVMRFGWSFYGSFLRCEVLMQPRSGNCFQLERGTLPITQHETSRADSFELYLNAATALYRGLNRRH
jgi:hypothetical protein